MGLLSAVCPESEPRLVRLVPAGGLCCMGGLGGEKNQRMKKASSIFLRMRDRNVQDAEAAG